jgi:hypothetical protein
VRGFWRLRLFLSAYWPFNATLRAAKHPNKEWREWATRLDAPSVAAAFKLSMPEGHLSINDNNLDIFLYLHY